MQRAHNILAIITENNILFCSLLKAFTGFMGLISILNPWDIWLFALEWPHLSISAAKSSVVGAGANTGLPAASMSTTWLRLQPVVRTMKLHVWGTSISTWRKRWFCFYNVKAYNLSVIKWKERNGNMVTDDDIYAAVFRRTVQVALGPFFMGEVPSMAFRDSAS